MNDFRIESQAYYQLEHPNKNLAFMDNEEYTRRMRNKQNKMLQKLIDSSKEFDLKKAKATAMAQTKSALFEALQQPVVKEIKKATKSITDQMKGTFGLTQQEYTELFELLETYNSLKPNDRQRIITLFDKSNLSMEDRSRLLAIAGNKNPADDLAIYQKFNNRVNQATSTEMQKPNDESDQWEWFSSTDFEPHDVSDKSQIKFEPIQNSTKIETEAKVSFTPNSSPTVDDLQIARSKLKHVDGEEKTKHQTNENSLTSELQDTHSKLKHIGEPVRTKPKPQYRLENLPFTDSDLQSAQSKLKPIEVSFTPKTDNSPPSTDDLPRSNLNKPSTSQNTNEQFVPGKDSLKQTTFPDLPIYYDKSKFNVNQLNEQMNEFLTDKRAGAFPRNQKFIFNDMKRGRQNEFVINPPVLPESERTKDQPRDLNLNTFLLYEALKRDNKKPEEINLFLKNYYTTKSTGPYDLYKLKYDFITDNFSRKQWVDHFKSNQDYDDEGVSGEGLKRKKKGKAIVYLPSDSKSLHKLFEKGLSSIQAGNKSNNVKNQLSSILDRFVEVGELTNKQRYAIMKQYLEK